MKAGDLDRKVQFLRAEMVDDGYQQRPGPFVPYGSPVWAARKFIRDTERFAAGAVGIDAVARFTVRWSRHTDSVTHRDRITCEGRTYGIAGIKEIGRREGIEFTASELPE